MQVYGTTDVGKQRSENQDAIHCGSVEGRALVVVADGMGGHAGGAVASQLAVETFVNSVEAGIDEFETEALLERAVIEANEAVYERGQVDPPLENMGTTLVAALRAGPTDATLVNVGDSRAYAVADDIEQVTVDQSLVQDLVEAGDLDPEEAADHPSSNVLSQALGTDTDVEPDLYRWRGEGTLLLCSDGLTDELPEPVIRDIVDGTALAAVPDALVERANESGGRDNISVVVCESEE
jgi:serine/threonine protein phosphatase PrpC